MFMVLLHVYALCDMLAYETTRWGHVFFRAESVFSSHVMNLHQTQGKVALAKITDPTTLFTNVIWNGTVH